MEDELKIDPKRAVQRLQFGKENYVLVAEDTYEKMVRQMDGLQASLAIQRSRSEASFNFVDVLVGEKLTPEQIRTVLEAPTMAERLAVLRECRGMSQMELAEKAEVSQGTISKLESGETKRPSLELVERILTALELPDILTYTLMRKEGLPSVSRQQYARASR